MALPKIRKQIQNRVLKSGDTLTGPNLYLNNGYGRINTSSTLSVLETFNISNDVNNRRGIAVVNSGNQPELKSGLYYCDTIDGVTKTYRLYGEHNKPSAADIGTPSLTGDGATGNWNINITGNSATTTKLATARTIFGIGFNGTGNVEGKPLVYGTYTSTAANRFHQSGIEVRENGLVGNTQSDMGYAPSIGFHWSQRIAASLLFHNDGNFYLKKQNGTTRASLDANLIGNASTATKLATARTLTVGSTGKAFDGSGNVSWSLSEIGAAASNHAHNFINHLGNVTAETGTNDIATAGMSMALCYNNGYPINYGNVIRLKGGGMGEVLVGWSGTSGAHASVYYRSQRDTSDANWSSWSEIYSTGNSNGCKIQSATPATHMLWAW